MKNEKNTVEKTIKKMEKKVKVDLEKFDEKIKDMEQKLVAKKTETNSAKTEPVSPLNSKSSIFKTNSLTSDLANIPKFQPIHFNSSFLNNNTPVKTSPTS